MDMEEVHKSNDGLGGLDGTHDDAGGLSSAAAATSKLEIKTEPSATPGFSTPLKSTEMAAEAVNAGLDDETARAIAAAQNEHNFRERSSIKKSQSEYTPTPDPERQHTPGMTTASSSAAAAATGPSKKRSAPKSKAAASGTKKPPAKKRKVDALAGDAARRSGTPTSRKGLTSLTARTPLSSSPQPLHAQDSDSASEGGSDEDVYCICRKPDNHTWMIGCDGGCEDWFHGKCVKINREDEDLIDKYICPLCQQKGRGVTTWKPMCRREGCRKPARLKKGSESKYCTNDCGVAFMQHILKRTSSFTSSLATQSKNRRQIRKTVGGSDAYESEKDLGPLGGSIRPHELKALAESTSTADEFRRLGSPSLPTPPPSTTDDSPVPKHDVDVDFVDHQRATAAESARLKEIAAHKDVLRERRLMLKDREKFITMVKKRAVQAAEAWKVKDMCGFDKRVVWDDTSFDRWRTSEPGRAALEQGTLEFEQDSSEQADGEPASEGDGMDIDSLKPLPGARVAGTGPVDGQASTAEPELDLCDKKRCNRHKEWQKVMLQDVRFEEAGVVDEMRNIDAEERELKEDILRRCSADGGDVEMGGLDGSSGECGQDNEEEDGWVEDISAAALLSSSSGARDGTSGGQSLEEQDTSHGEQEQYAHMHINDQSGSVDATAHRKGGDLSMLLDGIVEAAAVTTPVGDESTTLASEAGLAA